VSIRRRDRTLLGACLLAATLVQAAVTHAASPRPAERASVRPLISSYFHTSDGVRLHVVEASPARIATKLPVLVFVPGWAMPAWLWDEQLRTLSTRYRTAALDPRGQGLSDVPAEGYTVERRARDIAELVARYPKVVLIGWSLAVLEALHYVHEYGDQRVEALVLVDNSIGEQPPPPPGSFTDALRVDRDKALGMFVHAIFRSKRSPEDSKRLLHDAMRLPLQAGIDLLSYPQPREYWRDVAWAFRKPLLYVVTPQFAEQAANLKRNRPGTQVEVFRAAGHALFVDEPQRFNALLEAFVASL
jgi:non-heme chloroperoxidase